MRTLPSFAVLLLLATGIAQPPPDKTPQAISTQQRAIVEKLASASRSKPEIEVWHRGTTVAYWRGTIPLRAADPEAAALAFVKQNAALWGLTDATVIRPDTQRSDLCTTVFVQRFHDGAAVLNSRLAIGMNKDGNLIGFEGRLSGSEIPKIEKGGITAEAAKQVLANHFEDPKLKLPEPNPVIVDPFFLADGMHEPRRAWAFSAQGRVLYLVDEVTGEVTEWQPPVSVNTKETEPSCPNDPSQALPEVVVDPSTETPAYVSFRHMRGIATSGANTVERAYNLIGSETLARMYGSLEPKKHLKFARNDAGPGGAQHVRFFQVHGTVPVEGAYVMVALDSGQRAQSLHSRFIYRPRAAKTASVTSAFVLPAALKKFLQLECTKANPCTAAKRTALMRVRPTVTLVVLSSQLFRGTTLPPKTERLAWRFVFPGQIIFWSASRPAEFLYSWPTRHTVIPFRIQNLAQGNRVELANDGTTVAPGITPDPEVTTLSGLVTPMDGFFLGVGRNSWDNAGGTLIAHVNLREKNAYWCTSPISSTCGTNEMVLGTGFTVGDVVAHEFTHGVTNITAMLAYAEESGALNESYSDVMGNLSFADTPATSWLMGETLADGANRDMKDPGRFGQPGHVGFMDQGCIFSPDRCVHTWSGVPNRAAVLISDGGIPGDPATGLTRAKMGRLYLDTLTIGGIGASSNFLHQRTATVDMCRSYVATPPGTLTFPPTDCDHVGRSFDTVGVTSAPQYGWRKFSTNFFGAGYNNTNFSGQRLFRGCTIADQAIWAQDANGAVRSSNIAAGLNVDMGGWGAYVTSRGATSDNTDRTIAYRVWSEWFHSGVVSTTETYNLGPGVTFSTQCLTPPAAAGAPERHPRTLYSASRSAHWATFLNGGRGDDAINSGVNMPSGCQIDGVTAVEYHKDGNGVASVVQYPLNGTGDHGNHGYTVSRAGNQTNTSLDASIHWWHNGDSGIFVRVVYNIFEDDGVDCSVSGSTQSTP